MPVFSIVHENMLCFQEDNHIKYNQSDKKKPVLDFYADWCAPCRMQATEVDKFAEKYGGEIKVGKINIDQEEFLAQLYDVTAVPTLISMENGDIIEKSVGLIPHHMIDQLFVKK